MWAGWLALIALASPLLHGALPPHTYRMGLRCTRAAHWVERFCAKAEVKEAECAGLLTRAQDACRKRGPVVTADAPLVIPVGLSPVLRITLHGDDKRAHELAVAVGVPDAAAEARRHCAERAT